ncbi:hypothetical protein GJAV_G00271900 [Gymnothorax javanicus]|nr:hypothetical protein GJAV_G00271900 [Gymnothorax javanicus]
MLAVNVKCILEFHKHVMHNNCRWLVCCREKTSFLSPPLHTAEQECVPMAVGQSVCTGWECTVCGSFSQHSVLLQHRTSHTHTPSCTDSTHTSINKNSTMLVFRSRNSVSTPNGI